MEGIIEYLVPKKKTGADSFKEFGVVLTAFILSALSIKFLGGFALLGIVAVVYAAYRIMIMLSLEYEYCIVDKDITVDKIMSKKKRKTIMTIDGAEILVIAKATDKDALQDYQKATLHFYAGDAADADNYAVVAHTKGKLVKVILKFDDRITEHFKMRMPSKVKV